MLYPISDLMQTLFYKSGKRAIYIKIFVEFPMTDKKNSDPRLVASSLIRVVLDQSLFLNELLADLISPFDFPKRRFITELVYGTIRNLTHIDFWISRVFKKPLKRINDNLLDLIRVSLYQIIFMSNREPATIVFEAAELAKRCGNERTAGFVNYILREILRQDPTRENMEKCFDGNFEAFLQTYYSIPAWLFVRLKRQAERLGDDIETMLQIVNRPLGITLRVDGDESERERVIESLRERGIEAEPAKECRYAVYTHKAVNFSIISEFKNVSIQDESSQLAVCELGIEPGDRILDLCSAPGGKTLFASYLTGDSGRVTAADVNANRLTMLTEAIVKNGKRNIEVKLQDGASFNPDWQDKFDKVLLDAPCSALGTIRRHPEIKWLKNNKDSAKMASISEKILNNACRYVKVGGILVFSVCTFTREESIDQIDRFTAGHENFDAEKSYYTVRETSENRDIFYICRMRRTK